MALHWRYEESARVRLEATAATAMAECCERLVCEFRLGFGSMVMVTATAVAE
jgi:hypothetical protein